VIEKIGEAGRKAMFADKLKIGRDEVIRNKLVSKSRLYFFTHIE
jgi:hypothetical protein